MSSPAPPWLELWRHATRLTGAGLAAMNVASGPGQLRQRWLADLDQTMDLYLRSPDFLQLMELGLAAMTRSRRLVSPPPPR